MIPSAVRPTSRVGTVPEPRAILAWLRARARGAAEAVRQPRVQVMWGIILLAAALRLTALDLIEFKADEANHLVRGLDIVAHGRLPFVGSPSSYGPVKPPMMSYLLAIPLSVSRDPRYAAAFVALLDVAAVAACYGLALRYYGRRVAVIAGLLFAANPWAVVLSRKVFTADLLAPFGVLLYGGLLAALVDRRRWGWVLAVVALAVMLLITYSPAPLIVVLLIVLAAYRRRVSWRYVALGVLLAVVLAAPYLYYLNLQGLADLREALNDVTATPAGDQVLGFGTLPVRHAMRLHSWTGLEALAGVSHDAFQAAGAGRLPGLLWAHLFLVSLFATVGLAIRAWSHWREREDAARYVLPALWLWVPLVLLTIWRGRVEQHYAVILYPAGFIAMALVIDRLLRALHGARLRGGAVEAVAPLMVWGLVLGAVAWQGYLVTALYRFVATHDTTGGYGVPLRVWQRTADLVRREVRASGADQVWVIASGVDPRYQNEPAVLSYLLAPDVRLAFLGQGGHEALLLPAERPGLYVITRPVDRAVQALVDMDGEVRGLVTLPDGRLAAQVMAVPERSAAEVLDDIPNRGLWVLDTGMHLLGYEWPLSARPGERVTLATYWALLDVPPEARERQHSLFNHLMAGGRRVAQVDGLGLAERHWQDGLVLLQWFEIELPAELAPGEYTLLTGMYALEGLGRSRVVAGGGVEEDAIALGPVRVGE